MEDRIFGIIGIMVLGCGIYSLYAYWQMKVTGIINTVILIGKEYTQDMCRDRDAYLKKALPAVLVFALTSVVYGVIDVVHFYVHPMPKADLCGMIVFIVVLIGFAVYTGKLKNQYFKK